MDGKAPTGMNKETPRVQNMTLRDWFAGQALAGMSSTMVKIPENKDCAVLASIAYRQADAMLKARGE